MTLVLVNSGEEAMLSAFLEAADLTLKLYKSNTTPGETDTAGTYTEADFTGYSAAVIDKDDWTITPGAPTSAVNLQKTFTSSADQSTQQIYGYFVVDGGGVLMWAERFPAGPYPIANNGDNVKVTPRFTQD